MRKKLIVALAALCLFAGLAMRADAATITGTAPTTGIGTLDTALQNAFNAALADANSNSALSKFSDQTDLARGFANANAYSSHAGTIQGYQNYDLFLSRWA